MGKAKVELAVSDWETVLNALGELPYKTAAPVFASITAQVRAQMETNTTVPAAAGEEIAK